MPLVADGVARADILQAHGGADIARLNFTDVFALVGVHLEQAANALGPATAGIEHRVADLSCPE